MDAIGGDGGGVIRRVTGALDPAVLNGIQPAAAPAAPEAAPALAGDAGIEPTKAQTSSLALETVGAPAVEPIKTDPLPPGGGGGGAVSDFSDIEFAKAKLLSQMVEMTSENSQAIAHESTDSGKEIKAQDTKKAKVNKPKKKKGGFFSKLMSAIKSILPVLSLVCMFVPGLQVLSLALKVAQAAVKAYELIQALKTGDWKAALGAVAGLAGSFGGSLGQLAKLGETGLKVANAAKNGDWGGALAGLGGMIGGDTGKLFTQAGSAVKAIQTGDISALAGAVGGLSGKIDPDTLKQLQGAVSVAEGAIKGDAIKALEGLSGVTGNVDIAKVSALAGAIEGRNPQAIAAAANELGIKTPAELNSILGKLEEVRGPVQDLIKAVDHGDVGSLVKTLGLDASAKKVLEEGFGKLKGSEISDELGLGDDEDDEEDLEVGASGDVEQEVAPIQEVNAGPVGDDQTMLA